MLCSDSSGSASDSPENTDTDSKFSLKLLAGKKRNTLEEINIPRANRVLPVNEQNESLQTETNLLDTQNNSISSYKKSVTVQPRSYKTASLKLEQRSGKNNEIT